MTRRDFLILATWSTLITRCAQQNHTDNSILTVKGPIEPSQMGKVLSHEHIMVDFADASNVAPDRYDAAEVFNVVLPYLREARRSGCDAFFDFTPTYLGRDPEILRRLSEATGVHIVTNTGYYGARGDVHLPPHAWTDSVNQLAERWILEFEKGIGETGIKPGFIKIGADPGSLSEIDAKLVRAAARAHLATGLTIAVHTGPAEGAFEQMEILAAEGVDLSAWIWVHAQNEPDKRRHVEAAQRGAWVAFEGINPQSEAMRLEQLLNMKENGLLNRVLISQDAGWYSVGEENGGDFQGYSYLLDSFVPAMRGAGFTQDEVMMLLERNPAEAFTVRVRAAG